ncbi:MAG TPA: AraC family transcriptional regulator [Planctomycetota bacterium]|nr:AraC family transcriptional regulator [Planctomycetota bacterium]
MALEPRAKSQEPRASTRFVFYPSPAPEDAALLSITSVGHFHLRSGFALDRMRGHHVEHMIYTLGGAARGEIAGQACHARAGTLWLMPKDQPYRYHTDTDAGFWEGRWIEYDGGWARVLWRRMHLEGVFELQHCIEAGRAYEQVFSNFQTRGNAALHENAGLLWQIFAHAERALQSGKRSESREESISRAQRFIQSHLADPIALADIAREARLSPFHFSRLFHKATGFAPAAYVRSLRISRAQELLRQGGLSVKEVGAAVGYPVVQNFSAAFRGATGMSPSEFVRKHG